MSNGTWRTRVGVPYFQENNSSETIQGLLSVCGCRRPRGRTQADLPLRTVAATAGHTFHSRNTPKHGYDAPA